MSFFWFLCFYGWLPPFYRNDQALPEVLALAMRLIWFSYTPPAPTYIVKMKKQANTENCSIELNCELNCRIYLTGKRPIFIGSFHTNECRHLSWCGQALSLNGQKPPPY